jgi:predicted aconitase with swiveling domain
VENRGLGQGCDIRPVVDGPELAVLLGGVTEDLEEFQLLGGLDGLVPQLDDVHAPGEGRIQEFGEIAALRSGVGAQVEPGVIVVHWTNNKGDLPEPAPRRKPAGRERPRG